MQMMNTIPKRSLLVLALALLMLPAFVLPVLGGDSVFVEEGKHLYSKICAGCHGDVEDSAKAGRSMTRIRSALRIQPQHRTLATLSDEDILLIAMALREGEE
jgi:cytochrome c553